MITFSAFSLPALPNTSIVCLKLPVSFQLWLSFMLFEASDSLFYSFSKFLIPIVYLIDLGFEKDDFHHAVLKSVWLSKELVFF
jgi:hypothetical protein